MMVLSSYKIFFYTAVKLVAFVGIAFIFGCDAETKVKTFRVSGTVNFKGEPVAIGNIFFEPNVSKSNSGPQGFADIKNGQFDTSAKGNIGVIGGDHILRIQGYNGVVGDEAPYGQPLFPEYTMEISLGQQDEKIEIVVPTAQ